MEVVCYLHLSLEEKMLKNEKRNAESKEKCCSHIVCLQENQYVSHLRLIFEMILERLQGRTDLGQEIQQTLTSLDQLVKFLTVPPDS